MKCTSRTHYKHKSLPFHPRKRDGSLPDDKGVLTCEPKSSQPTQITNLCLDEFFLISIRMIRHDLKVPIFTPFSHEESQAGRRTHAVKIGGHYTLDAKSIRVARNVSQFARAQWWKETKLLKICDSPKPTLNSSHHCQKAKAGEIVAGHIYKIPGSKGKYRDVVVTALNQDGKRAILFEVSSTLPARNQSVWLTDYRSSTSKTPRPRKRGTDTSQSVVSMMLNPIISLSCYLKEIRRQCRGLRSGVLIRKLGEVQRRPGFLTTP